MTTDNPQMDHLIARMDSDEVPYKTSVAQPENVHGATARGLTDLEAFDRFAEKAGLSVDAFTVGNFLPVRQFVGKRGYIINFMFGDDGSFQEVSVSPPPSRIQD